jgi:hypothetical protein
MTSEPSLHKVKRKECPSSNLWSVSLPHLSTLPPTATTIKDASIPPESPPSQAQDVPSGIHHSPSFIDLNVIQERGEMGRREWEDGNFFFLFFFLVNGCEATEEKSLFIVCMNWGKQKDSQTLSRMESKKSTAIKRKETRKDFEWGESGSMENGLPNHSKVASAPPSLSVAPSPSSSEEETLNATPSQEENQDEQGPRKRIGDWILGDTIGEGSFAKVKMAFHSKTHESVGLFLLEFDVKG